MSKSRSKHTTQEVLIAQRTYSRLFLAGCLVLVASGARAGAGIWTTNGPAGGTVYVIASAPSNRSILYAGTLRTVFKSSDSGRSWNSVSNGLPTEEVYAIAVHPTNPDVVYASSHLDGLFKTTNGGTSWVPVGGGLAGSPIMSLAIRPTNPNVCFAGSWFAGLYMTANGGASWNQVTNGLSANARVMAIAIDPSNSQIMYLGSANYPAGLYKSVDGGANWAQILVSYAYAEWTAIAIDPSNPSRILASAEYIDSGVYHSSNAGIDWQQVVYDDKVFALYFDPSRPGTAYCGGTGSTVPGQMRLKKSSDGGVTWVDRAQGLPFSGTVNALAIDPLDSDRVLAGTDTGIFESRAGGIYWINPGNGGCTYSPPDWNQIGSFVVDPIDPLIVYGGSYGDGSAGTGMCKSIDGGVTWTPITAGLPAGQAVGKLVMDPTNAQILYASTTSGVYKSIDGGGNWKPATAGLPGASALAIDPLDPDVLYAYTGSTMYKTTDGGANWAPANNGLGWNVTDIAVDPVTPGTVYTAGDYAVFKTTNGGGNWAASGAALPNWTMLLEFDSSDPSVLYVGCGTIGGGTGIYRSGDGGTTWTAFGDAVLMAEQVESISVDPQNSQRIFVGVNSSYPCEFVCFTPDRGTTWQSAGQGMDYIPYQIEVTPSRLYATGMSFQTTAADGLEWIPNAWSAAIAYSVAVPAFDGGVVYAAAWRSGVQKSANAGATWSATELSWTATTAVTIAPSESATTLYAATYYWGEGGMYRSVDAGASWTGQGYINIDGYYIGTIWAIAVDPANASVVYVGSASANGIVTNLIKSIDGGTNWSRSDAGIPTGATVYALAIDPIVPTTLYAAVISQGVYKSINGGASWIAINSGLPNFYAWDVAVVPSDPNTLYAAINSGGVFKSTTAGSSWVPVNSGLTDLAITAIAVDPINAQVVYAGTAAGRVFRTSDGGTSWTPFDTGMGNAAGIRSLAISADGAVIHAATNGQGVYDYTFCAAPNAAITAPAAVCALSSGNAASMPDAGAGATYAWTIASGSITAGQGTSAILFGAGPSGQVTLGATVGTALPGCFASATTVMPISLVTLSPATLPQGVLGVAYAAPLSATGGTTPYAFSTAGPLPAGLTLDAGGQISGVPTIVETQSFTVTATDAMGCSADRGYTLEIVCLALGPESLPDATLGASYNQTLVASGGAPPYNFTLAGALPAGLLLDPASGQISGTPTESGRFVLTATVADTGACTASQLYTLAVCDPAMGDLNLTATVNASDAVILANYLVGNLTQGAPPFTAPLAQADFDRSTSVISVDAVILANFLVGNLDCLPTM